MLIDVLLTAHVPFQTPLVLIISLFTFPWPVCASLCVCGLSTSASSVPGVARCQHSVTKVLPLTPVTQKQIHTGRKVTRGKEFKISSHILTFCHSFSLSTHPYCLSSALLHTYTHTHTNIPEPSKLESKVPIAFLIRIASGTVSKSKLCELQSPCTRLDIKALSQLLYRHIPAPCKLTCSVIRRSYKHRRCQLCLCFVCSRCPLYVHVGKGLTFWVLIKFSSDD